MSCRSMSCACVISRSRDSSSARRVSRAADFGGLADGDIGEAGSNDNCRSFRGSLYREWLAYASDAKRIAEAFVAGVNAYVELTERQPDLLPLEFRRLGYKPSRWDASDIVRIRHHGLTLNLTGEVDRAESYCKDGREAPRVDWMRRALVPDITPI